MAARPYTEGPGVDVGGLRPKVRDAFTAMAQEFLDTTGQKIYVTSAYRSTQQQAALHALNPLKAAKPGRSMHEYGYAIDIGSSYANRLVHMGLLDKYGFCRPMMRTGINNKEPWHIEPKGLVYSAIRAAGYIPTRTGMSVLLVALGILYLISKKGRRV